MKTALLGFIILVLAACQHSSKEQDLATVNVPVEAKEEISKNTFTDRFGDTIGIITNVTKNRLTVHLNGKTYELKKDLSSPAYSTEDNTYQLTDTKYEITFLKKDINMVLFHTKKEKPSAKIAGQ